ncbi:MAG TPA: ATP-binding cassette domain-containing protein [Pirellulales bacterium]
MSPSDDVSICKHAVQALNLTKRYGTAAAPVVGLHQVTLEVPRGQRVALLGKSGSGKSTLLNLLGGLDRPTSGAMSVAGRELQRLGGI